MLALYIFFVVLTISTTNTQGSLQRADSCYSAEDITVPYTLWIGTDIREKYSVNVTVKQYTAFYDVMRVAEEQEEEQYK
jgi:hypothetical protein